MQHTMTVAFLVLNHRPPAQLLRLLTTLRRGDPAAPLVVHHDRFRSELAESEIETLGNVHLLLSDAPVVWGDFSVVKAYWRSLNWMLERMEFDWVVVLSAQDYPIKPLTELRETLSRSGVDAFIQATRINDLTDPEQHAEMRLRYLYQYRRIPLIPAPANGGVLHRLGHRGQELFFDTANALQSHVHFYKLPDGLPRRVGIRARSTPFDATFPCWYGNMWSILSRRSVELLVTVTRSRPEYVAYYRRTIIPDESATHTIICNARELHIQPIDLHYARWTRGVSGHPDVFGVADLPELLASPSYFARKFDIAQDADVLDQLDQAIMRGPSFSEDAPTDR
jgi:hypothetical protein